MTRRAAPSPAPTPPEMPEIVSALGSIFERAMIAHALTSRRPAAPVDLQSAWLAMAEASLRAGAPATDAAANAQIVIALFVARARELAEQSASLPYLDRDAPSADLAADADAEPPPAP